MERLAGAIADVCKLWHAASSMEKKMLISSVVKEIAVGGPEEIEVRLLD